jgi:hypothetical protein
MTDLYYEAWKGVNDVYGKRTVQVIADAFEKDGWDSIGLKISLQKGDVKEIIEAIIHELKLREDRKPTL